MRHVAQQSIGSALVCGSSSKLVPRAEPAVTAEAEPDYALIEVRTGRLRPRRLS
jgi:hypothetical protein